MKKLLLKSLIICSIFSLCSCKDNKEPESDIPPKQEEIIVPHFEYSESDYLFKNGAASYAIVKENKDSSYLQFAGSELTSIFYESTGLNLKSYIDSDLPTGKNFISIGNTVQFKNSHPDFDYSIFANKDSKFMIDTIDKNIYLIGNPYSDDQSYLYAVYALLEDLIDYRFYAQDEIFFKKVEYIKLPIYKAYIFEPSFDVRSIMNGDTIYNVDYNRRAKVASWYVNDNWCSEAMGHNQFSLINANYNIYSNSSWINSANLQLCWSSFDVVGENSKGKTASEAVAEQYVKLFERYPNASYYMFGQQDVVSFCQCERCEHLMNEKAYNQAGLQIMFLNRVLEHLKPWFDTHKERTIRIVPYAYYSTKLAPVVKDNGGNYVPFSEYVIPDEHIYVEYAAIEANHVHPFTNTNISENKELNDVIEGWDALLEPNHFIMYIYDTNFRTYFINFNNFGAIKADYEFLKSKNVFYIYSQGAGDSPQSTFQEMRFFVESNLMYDLRYDHDGLVREFMEHYYKNCYEDMYEYYDVTREILTCACTSAGLGTSKGGIYGVLSNTETYSLEKVIYLNKLFKKMFATIDTLRTTDPTLAETLYKRVVREYLSIIYLNVTLYKDNFSRPELDEMKEIFNKYVSVFGIIHSSEGGAYTLNFD